MWCRLEAMPIPITPYAFYANAQSSPLGFCHVLQFVLSNCMKMMELLSHFAYVLVKDFLYEVPIRFLLYR